MAAAFAEYYQLNRITNPALADQALRNAEDIFALADTSYSDPGAVGRRRHVHLGCLLTIIPFDGYPETVWDDDMELGATELYFALAVRRERNLPPGLPITTDPTHYLPHAAQFAKTTSRESTTPAAEDTLNLYDVSGLAHFELYRALRLAGNPAGLAVNRIDDLDRQFLKQVGVAITQVGKGCVGLRRRLANGDTTSHGAGLSVMASEAYYLTGSASYNTYSQKMAGQYSGRQLLGIVVHRGRRQHISQLHPAPGGESGGSVEWNLGRHARALGRGFRGSG